MVKIIIITVLLCCMTAALARDETSSCRDVTRQTCQGFQQCCARKCGGAHDTSCTESNGRISMANCECRGGSTHAGAVSGSGGREIDYSASCKAQAHGSCNSFKTCCEGRCPRPLRLNCNTHGSSLTDALCHCPASAGSYIHTTPYYPGSHSGHGHSVTGGTHGGTQGGLREHGDQDFTQTCTRNYHDCTTFRNCCTNRCSGRNVQAQCQERGGRLTNTLCKCTGI